MNRDEKRFIHDSGDGFYSDLEVCQSAAGFYIGRMHWNKDMGGFIEPGSRESDYFPTREVAEEGLKTFRTPRQNAETEHLYSTGTVPHQSVTPERLALAREATQAIIDVAKKFPTLMEGLALVMTTCIGFLHAIGAPDSSIRILVDSSISKLPILDALKSREGAAPTTSDAPSTEPTAPDFQRQQQVVDGDAVPAFDVPAVEDTLP